MINSKSDGYIGGVSMKYNYDYSQTLWMKLFMAKPDFPNHKSEVYFTFEQALDVIKTVDCLTQGIKKIVYLVGWQGLGHDDCYPEMEVVNEFLKRDCDKTASESLFWLFEEAKKYNTVVSFHGNVADEYGDNASHREIVEANAVANSCYYTFSPKGLFSDINYLPGIGYILFIWNRIYTIYLGWLLRARKPRGV